MAGKRTLPSSIESQEGKTNQAKQQAASLPSANPNIDKAEEQLEKGLSSYATQQERLHASTVSGGLKAIPQQFYDPNGDWQLTFDPNYFKRLYLDHTEYKIITNELLEKNYRVILSFWDGIKWQYEHSGNTDQLIRIFEKTSFIESSHHHLKEAYDRIKKAGVDTYYYQIEQQRKERGKRLLEPHLTDLEKTLNATRVLLSSNENFIKNFARLSTPLTEEEVTEELELLLQKTNSERRQDGFSKEHEYFLFDIREKLRDLVLQNEEEEELISHAQNKYKITSFPEIEQLIRKHCMKRVDLNE